MIPAIIAAASKNNVPYSIYRLHKNSLTLHAFSPLCSFCLRFPFLASKVIRYCPAYRLSQRECSRCINHAPYTRKPSQQSL